MKTQFSFAAMFAATLVSCGPGTPGRYPAADRENVCDVYFGDTVQDPYRWMEDDSDPRVAAWVSAQNALSGKYLSSIPFRDRLRDRLTELYDYERISLPQKKGGKYYFFRNDGLSNQSVLYCSASPDLSGAVMVLDPNTLSEDGTAALAGISFSEDGRYLAYSVSRSGSDWNEISVLDLESGKLLEDHIKWCKFSGAEWLGDGFFYSAYDAPEDGREYVAVNEGHKVMYHRLGTPQQEDELFYSDARYPQRFYSAEVADGGRLVFIHESGMGSGNLLHVKDMGNPSSGFVRMTDDAGCTYAPIGARDGRILVYTNYGAPRYRIMEADMSDPSVSRWKEVVPQSDAVLSSASVCGDSLCLVYDKDVVNRLFMAASDGSGMREVALPGAGTVAVSADRDGEGVYYSYMSFTVPQTIFRYDPATGSSETVFAPETGFDGSAYETKQVFFSSEDGTPVPMFIVHRKDMKLDGSNPVFMTGYGGFAISMYPSFSVNYIPFLESGGIYVQVNLRGGSEYGEEWHLAGTKLRKQNVFDDFISAARYLIANGYTSKGLIGISGGSNGGLLIGACVNQAPDLFGAAVPRVGVMDMLRYHLFTIGWNWAPDYGTSADSEEMYRCLRSYSPLHNISNDGTPYPAVMVTTADHDDRVVPAHSFKYAAALQWADTGDRPKIIRIDSKAGHGAGKPTSKVIDEQADIYAFIMYNLGMRLKGK